MILVVGSTGTLGREVVHRLATVGLPVRALVRRAVTDADGAMGVDLRVGNLADLASLRAALDDVDRVFLCSSADPRLPELQSNLVAAAAEAGVVHVVKASILGASPESPLLLCRWHGEAERALERSGIAFTHVRPNLFVQTVLGVEAAPALEAGSLVQPTGRARLSLVDARDVAAVAVAALTMPGHARRAYDVTGPEAISMAELAVQLAAATGHEVRHVDPSPAAYATALAEAGFAEPLATALCQLYESYRESGTDGYAAAVTQTVLEVTGTPPRRVDDYVAERWRVAARR